MAKGEYIAVFDADFLPSSDFLKQTIPFFADPCIGMVQTKWGHINKDTSLLAKLQAIALDGHFSVEQQALRAEAATPLRSAGLAKALGVKAKDRY